MLSWLKLFPKTEVLALQRKHREDITVYDSSQG
jgi:hypothetical protein